MFKKVFVFKLSFLLLICFSSNTVFSSDDPIIKSRTPYTAPFKSYDRWLKFMDRARDPAWRAEPIAKLIDRTSFERFQQQTSVKVEKIAYYSDGLAINGFVFTPKSKMKKYPVVLFAHGGVAKWGRITFFELLEMQRLAESGYIVIASALRGEGGSEGKPNLGAGDRSDMLNLLKVAATMDNADLDNVGIWGVSRGGALGYRMLAASKQFKAAVFIGAPSDAINSPRRQEFHQHVYPGIVDGYEEDQDAALKAISAVFWPEKIADNTAILLLHGTDDVRVPVSASLNMAIHFARLKRTFRLVTPEHGSHSLVEHLQQVRAERLRWFDKYLK